MRLGDLDALLNEVRNNKELYERERVYLEGLLLNAPTVEERYHGEWEEPFEHNGKIYHKCNHCHASIPLMLIDNYCSYCGAEMVGGIKNETDN